MNDRWLIEDKIFCGFWLLIDHLLITHWSPIDYSSITKKNFPPASASNMEKYPLILNDVYLLMKL